MPGVNDFAFKVANVNGSGSASANSLLVRAIFRMGVPVSGKNLLPSNIQGMPTWYEIRVNFDSHTARASSFDLVVAMNAQTYVEDVASVRTGGYVLFDSSALGELPQREDVHYLGVPFSTLIVEQFTAADDLVLLKNIAYVGSLVAVLEIDRGIVDELLAERFRRNEHARESNARALQLGLESALKLLDCPLPFHIESMYPNSDKILIDGNTATALGCLYAGATVAAWYPITPATSIMDGFASFCERYRSFPPQEERILGEIAPRNNYLILQAEDELAAIGIVIGASWNGARAFTSTSGPGISLMNELLGLAYYAEIPAVVFDVQRSGPSTGMPTRTQQADLFECAYASHGDTKHLLLFPADPTECFEFAVSAFDYAERFQTPVIVLSDFDIGMNDWTVSRLRWDDRYLPERGRVLGKVDLEKMDRFFRYDNVDEDFVAARTLPGVDARGAYFTRGSGHDRFGGYTETPKRYQEVMERLSKKHHAAARHMPAPLIDRRLGSRFGVVAFGSSDLAVREAIVALEGTHPLDYLRVRSFPFQDAVPEFIDQHERTIVVEQNRDGQLRSLLSIETGTPIDRLGSVRLYGGLPLTAPEVVDGILSQIGG